MARAVGYGNQLRVIGGRWRGRRLRFIPVEDLRPTSGRIRETLFNWLAPLIAGSRCLDLFAGSGALGIEALSRGAAEVVFVERHSAAAAQLRENLRLLDAAGWQVERADALAWLRGRPEPFDIAFLDPPFGRGLLPPACAALEQGGWLKPEARIYLEGERVLKDLHLPGNWEIFREKAAGQVAYRLALRNGGNGAAVEPTG